MYLLFTSFSILLACRLFSHSFADDKTTYIQQFKLKQSSIIYDFQTFAGRGLT